MVNSEEFIVRLEKILEYYSLSASAFADKIGVQRSSLSHLLSGRNKPSLDFILKILDVFPEVDLYWILNGKGNFPKDGQIALADKSSDQLVEEKIKVDGPIQPSIKTEASPIDRIVIFYKDGTFTEHQPK